MSNLDEAAMLAFAQRFFAAAASGDVTTLRAMYAPDVVIWHAHDQVEQNVDQNLAVLGWIKAHVRDFRYEDVRCQATATGFVEHLKLPHYVDFQAELALLRQLRAEWSASRRSTDACAAPQEAPGNDREAAE